MRMKLFGLAACLSIVTLLGLGACSKTDTTSTTVQTYTTAQTNQPKANPTFPTGEHVEVILVTGPLTPINPGGPTVEITLKNVGIESINSLTATLDLGNTHTDPFTFDFGITQSNPLLSGATASATMTLIGGGFDSTATYPLTINASFLMSGTTVVAVPTTTSSVAQVQIVSPGSITTTTPPSNNTLIPVTSTSPGVTVPTSTIPFTTPAPPTTTVTLTTTSTAPALQRPATDNFVVVSAGFILYDPAALPISNQSGSNYIPYGATIIHWGNGITEVFGPDGQRLLIARDADAAQMPTPGGPVAATKVLQVPSGATVGTGSVTFNGKVILTIVNNTGSYPPA